MSNCTLRLAIIILLCWCLCMGKSPDCYEDEGGSTSLSTDFYKESCRDAEAIILAWVTKAVSQDPRMAASLLRLHFHDCFVNGCDASVLLDDTPTLSGEKTAGPNLNSLRGFDLIDSIKCDLEAACPETISCADILATAARDSVVLSGGPGWDVEMGRRDSFTANKTAANTDIPAPNSNVATLISKFQNVGLDVKDMVALSGGHTIGRARCSTFTPRLRTALATTTNVDPNFISSLQQLCSDSTNNNATLAFLDLATPSTFDNQYFVNLVSGEGLLQSDQVLMSANSPTRPVVESYATDMLSFFQDFTESMVKMGGINALVGNNGEIRRYCRTTN